MRTREQNDGKINMYFLERKLFLDIYIYIYIYTPQSR